MTEQPIEIYGIKNCDTMKKARTWLKDAGIEVVFHNYKKDGANKAVLKQALDDHGWETVINRRGTTWRQLPDDLKDAMDAENAITIAMENPSIIKRPLLVHDGKTYLGFKEDDYKEIFKDQS